jgi:hypothetical protein
MTPESETSLRFWPHELTVDALLDVAEGIDSVFLHTFATYYLPHRSNPREDLDMAGSAVVKVFEDHLGQSYPDMPWEPKAAFAALAAVYRS